MKPTEIFRELPTLKTKRLILRKMTMADAEAVHFYGRNPEVTKYLGFPTHKSIEDAKSFLRDTKKRHRKGEPVPWAIVRRQDDQFMGSIGLFNHIEKDGRIEAGYVLDKPYWGQGYMTEAFSAVIQFAFQRLRVNRVQAFCSVDNDRSYHVMEKCGMRFEGILRQYGKLQGITYDMKLYAILREEWLARRRGRSKTDPSGGA